MDLEEKVQYRLVKSKRRKHAAIKIASNGEVEVRVPYWYTKAQADRIVTEKSRWIRTHQKKILSRPPEASHFYDEGDTFYLLGKPYLLTITEGVHASVIVSHDRLVCCIGSRAPGPDEPGARNAYVRRKIRKWYTQQAGIYFLNTLTHLTSSYPQLRNKSVDTRVRVRIMRRRWGSCNKAGEITCNTQLLCAPESMITYVIIHELCHRVHFNHKKKFYELLQRYIPDYTQLEDQLHKHSGLWRI